MSAALGEQRTVSLYLPNSFGKTTRSYPVIFLTDGEYYFERAVLASRQLAISGHIPDCIVAAIDTPERRQDMTPPGMSTSLSDGPDQRGEKFMHFLADELKPQLESKFRAGAPSVLMGHSHGGILCAYAAAKWRKDFPFIVALDAPMHLETGVLNRRIVDSAAALGNLRIVSVEARFGWSDAQWAALGRAAPKNWILSRIKLPGEDHESMVFAGFYQGLKQLFADYSQVQVKSLPGEVAFSHYLKLEPLYGSPVIPPKFVLERATENLTALGQGELARKALEQWQQGYGTLPDYAERVADIQTAEKAMQGKESVRQLLELPPPTANAMKPYLGEWSGYSWLDTDPDRQSAITVTFLVEGGHGVAKIVNHDAPPEFVNETCRFLRVTSKGIEFGNVNGMFPPGIVARVGILNDGKLHGQSEFLGVFFRPRGDPWPRQMFTLTRNKPLPAVSN